MKSAKQLESLRIGVAGEHLVVAQMNLRGWDASLTEKNYPMIDIFGRNPQTGQFVSVQVKSSSPKANSFLIGFNHNNRHEMEDTVMGPYVFVHFNDDLTADFYILSKKKFIELVNRTDDIYFNKPRRTPIKDNYPIDVKIHDLAPYKDAWENLWK